MKKASLVAGTIALLLLAAACGGSSSPSTSAPSGGGGNVSAAAGKAVFVSNCASCHTLADAGTSGTVGPNLDDLKPDDATVVHQVTNGGGVMPSFEGKLSTAQIQSVAKYVSTVAGNG
jgi:mono/diheme cytochrome c family protein